MANSKINYEEVITDEMYEALVEAALCGEDPCIALKKIVPKSWTVNEVKGAIRYMQSQKEKIEGFKKTCMELEKATLISHDKDTIMLMFKKLIEKATSEGKYEVVTRILREIRQMQAIDNEQMKFEIIITVKPPVDNNNKDNDKNES